MKEWQDRDSAMHGQVWSPKEVVEGQEIDNIARRGDNAITVLICSPFCSVRYFCAEDLPDNLVLGILGEGSRYRAFIFRS